MGHDDAVSKICWHNDRLYSASWDSTVKVGIYFLTENVWSENIQLPFNMFRQYVVDIQGYIIIAFS